VERKTTIDSPKQLTVTMFNIVVTQIVELRIPKYLIRLGIEIEINFFELLTFDNGSLTLSWVGGVLLIVLVLND
jgi:hypothetical protein